MSDLKSYIKKRKSKDLEFAIDYDEGFNEFKIGIILKQLRLNSGLSQQELADRLHTHKPAISRFENHAEDIRLSTLFKIAHALGKKLDIRFIDQKN